MLSLIHIISITFLNLFLDSNVKMMRSLCISSIYAGSVKMLKYFRFLIMVITSIVAVTRTTRQHLMYCRAVPTTYFFMFLLVYDLKNYLCCIVPIFISVNKQKNKFFLFTVYCTVYL